MRISILILSTIVLSIVGCHKVPTMDSTLSEPTTTIAHLRSMVGTQQRMAVEDDIIVHGRVTSSDSEGNFSHSLVVQDGSGALEILISERNLATTYPEGVLLALHLRGCVATYSQGVLQVGAPTQEYEYYNATYIESRESQRRIIRRSTDVEPITPMSCTIAELTERDRGSLVNIEGLTLYNTTSIDTLEGQTLADATWRGYSLFRDVHGDTIAVYTSPEAQFATRGVPLEALSITGILQWSKYDGGDESLCLKMRYASDYEAI